MQGVAENTVNRVFYASISYKFLDTIFKEMSCFGCLEGRFWLKIGSKKHLWNVVSPSLEKVFEITPNVSPADAFWRHFGCLLGLLGSRGSGLGVTFGTGGGFFVIFFKKCSSADSMPLSSGSAIFAVRAAKLEALGFKSRTVDLLWRPFWRLGEGRVRGALSELWKSSETAGPQPRTGSRRRAKSI